MRLLKGVIVSLGVLLSVISNGQDAAFSQFYAAGLYLNPALVGSEQEATFKSSFRTQWRSITIPYVTSQMSLIKPLYSSGIRKNHYGGIGVSFYNDKAGDGNLKTLGIMGSAAYNLALNTAGYHFLSFGMQGGFVQKQLDFTNLEWGEQFNPYIGFDPSITPSNTNVLPTSIVPDVNAGVMYYFNGGKNYLYKGFSAYSGVAVYHLLEPDESIVKDIVSRAPRLYKYHGGIEIHATEKLNISPNLLFMYQGENNQFNGGIYLTYEMVEKHSSNLLTKSELILGGWYRLSDAFIFLAGIENDYYTIGFSYDMNNSSLRTAARGAGQGAGTRVAAYEISLSLRMVKEKKLAKFSTPRI